MKITLCLDIEQIRSLIREKMMETALFKTIKEVRFKVVEEFTDRMETQKRLVLREVEVEGER